LGIFWVIEPSSEIISQVDTDCITFPPAECDARFRSR